MKKIWKIIFLLILLGGLHKQAYTETPRPYVVSENQIKIAYDHYRAGHSNALIIAHGFYNNKDTYLFKKIAESFLSHYDVILFDFRGHGQSTGSFEWTAAEAKDLAAIIQYADKQGYQKIGVMGFSLGAAISLVEASQNHDIDSLIVVSAPYDFWKINYHFWKPEMFSDLKLNLGPKGRGKSIRPHHPFHKKVKPIDIVDQISPVPILFIHGKKDWLISYQHSEKLYQKAREPKKLVILPQAGHAEKIFDADPEKFHTLCLQWLEQTL
jgi:pimeloyl-ACP methyl ester carboxylesterase